MSDSLKILSLRFKSSFGDDAFIISSATIEEFLSEPYLINVKAYTSDESFDGDSLINQEAAIVFETYGSETGYDDEADQREFHGVITSMEHIKTVTDTDGTVRHYFNIQLRPSFWMLKYGSDYRIFQDQSALDIIQAIFDDQSITNTDIQASGGTTVREYCVQYGETHFDFVSRLLEEEGIGYYFTHTDSSHTMVIFDESTSFETVSQDTLNYIEQYSGDIFADTIYHFGKKSQIASSAYQALDFNYTTPDTQLLSSSSGDGFGGGIYEYPGLFDKSVRGTKLSDMRIEELEWFTTRVYGSSTAATISAGYTFTLAKHPLKAYNKEYAVSYVKHEMESRIDSNAAETAQGLEFTYKNSFEGFLKTVAYRPLRKTKKPRIYGSQTAMVTGSGTEVYGDDMARIKIKFHWDLLGEDDETSSLWVRVSQSLSGSSWGALYMPRIGMEVVVSFIDGDPDRPIVTGCVYNQSFMPPYSPESNPHYMTLKSKTFDDDEGFNELRFSDEAGSEEIYIHAQYDMNTKVENDMNTDVGNDVTTVIENDRTETINSGNDTLTISTGNKEVTQSGDGTTFITTITSGDYTIKLEDGNVVIDVTGTVLIQATDDITIKTDTTITMDAGEDIIMKAGDNIKGQAGADIQMKADENIKAEAGSDITIKAEADLNESAGGSITVKAEESISSKAGTTANIKAGTDFNLKAGKNGAFQIDATTSFKTPKINIKAETMFDLKTATMNVKADTMVQLKSDATLMMQAGAMLKIKSDAALMAEGGAMAAFKGAITKLG